MKNHVLKAVAAALAILLLFGLGSCIKDWGKLTSSANPVSSATPLKIEASKAPSQPQSSKPDAAPSSTQQKIAVEGITLSTTAITLEQGSSSQPTATVKPSNATNKDKTWSSNNVKIAKVSSGGKISAVGVGSCTVTVRSKDNPNVFAKITVNVTPAVPRVEPELTYIDGILIANKTYPLPSTYNPGVDSTANTALKSMFAAAKADGLNLFICSGFRSYTTQKNLYNRYVKRDGVAAADRYSARPGHSEHQTGLAFDINKADSSFVGTPEAKWLAENSYKYGFIIRYPEGKESITGYKYEPWHVRYLGVETATAVYNSGLCLEEYLGITSVYNY